MSTHAGITRRTLVVVSAVFMTACSDAATEAPTGIYTVACDSLVTINFKAEGLAEVNRNFCEGYGVETWEYAVDGDTLQMAHQGNLFDPGKVQVKFRISSPDELTAISDTGFLTCNNCPGNEVWTKK